MKHLDWPSEGSRQIITTSAEQHSHDWAEVKEKKRPFLGFTASAPERKAQIC